SLVAASMRSKNWPSTGASLCMGTTMESRLPWRRRGESPAISVLTAWSTSRLGTAPAPPGGARYINRRIWLSKTRGGGLSPQLRRMEFGGGADLGAAPGVGPAPDGAAGAPQRAELAEQRTVDAF